MTAICFSIMGLAASLLWALPILAQEQASSETESSSGPTSDYESGSDFDPMIVIVNGVGIRRSEVIASLQIAKPGADIPPNIQLATVIERLIDSKLLLMQARDAIASDDPELQKRLSMSKDKIIQSLYLERYIHDLIDEEDLRQRYHDIIDERGPITELDIDQILVPSEDRAHELLKQLGKGKNFADLARAWSLGPEAKQGGRLTNIRHGDMPSPIFDALVDVDEGELAAAPVATHFGWHILRLIERREKPAPPFETMQDSILTDMSHRLITQHLEDLRSQATIMRFEFKTPHRDEDGNSEDSKDSASRTRMPNRQLGITEQQSETHSDSADNIIHTDSDNDEANDLPSSHNKKKVNHSTDSQAKPETHLKHWHPHQDVFQHFAQLALPEKKIHRMPRLFTHAPPAQPHSKATCRACPIAPEKQESSTGIRFSPPLPRFVTPHLFISDDRSSAGNPHQPENPSPQDSSIKP